MSSPRTVNLNEPRSIDMRPLGERIREVRRRRGLSLQALAEDVGCTRGYLSQVETGRRTSPPSERILRALEAALGLKAGELVRSARWARIPPEIVEEIRALRAIRRRAAQLTALMQNERELNSACRSGVFEQLMHELAPPREGMNGMSAPIGGLPVQVPVVGDIVTVLEKRASRRAGASSAYLSLPLVHDADAYASRVVGDGMSPAYADGDLVVFSPMRGWDDGSDCSVELLDDRGPVLRRVFADSSFGVLRLQPLNCAQAPEYVRAEAVRVIHPAVCVVRSVPRGPGGPERG